MHVQGFVSRPTISNICSHSASPSLCLCLLLPSYQELQFGFPKLTSLKFDRKLPLYTLFQGVILWKGMLSEIHTLCALHLI